MLTIFTVPKPFRGHIGIIQKNAIKSWLQLHPECEILLFGDDEGVAETATEFGTCYIPDIVRNEFGTPLLDSVFRIAQSRANYQLLVYLNADIILMSDFLQAVSKIHQRRFLMLGQRWDLDVKTLLDFGAPDWESRLRYAVDKYGRLHPSTGVDYYLFTRGLFGEIPPFAIGRTAYDNWLIFKARAMGAPVIDATRVITCIHQNHERTYTSVGLQGPQGENDLTKGVEANKNIKLMGSNDHAFTLDYATWRLTSRGLKRDFTLKSIYYRLVAIPVLHPRLSFLLIPKRVVMALSKVFNTKPDENGGQ